MGWQRRVRFAGVEVADDMKKKVIGTETHRSSLENVKKITEN